MRTTALIVALLASPVLAAPPVPDAIDSPMFADPDVRVAEVVKTYPPGLLDLWLAALDRPDADSRCRAATAITLAHQQGMPGLNAAVPAFTRLMNADQVEPVVRAAAVRALVALDARESAADFLRHTRSGDNEVCEAAEPALAKWDHKPARELWLERLGTTRFDRRLTLAIQALGAVKEEKAAPKLRELALAADVPAAFRLEAARTLVRIRPTDKADDLAPLLADTSPKGMTARLVGVTLACQQTDADGVKRLQQLARDPEPAVARVAVSRLLEVGPKHVLDVIEPVLNSPDAAVRVGGVESLFRNPTADRVRVLGDKLDDPHPDVRVRARRALRELAGQQPLRDAVIEQVTRAVQATSWRPQEQGAMLSAQLGHRTETPRLLDLLSSERPEVMVASAWALRVLAVPDTLPGVFDYLKQRRDLILAKRTGTLSADALDRQLSQLVQFIGFARHKVADADLRVIVPRTVRGGGPPPSFSPLGPETRAAAVWALGKIFEGTPDAKLCELIEPRLTGDGSLGPDDVRVRRMAAVALGRMKAASYLETLEKFSNGELSTTDPVDYACRWAVCHLKGTPLPAPGRVEAPQKDWFVVPNK